MHTYPVKLVRWNYNGAQKTLDSDGNAHCLDYGRDFTDTDKTSQTRRCGLFPPEGNNKHLL